MECVEEPIRPDFYLCGLMLESVRNTFLYLYSL